MEEIYFILENHDENVIILKEFKLVVQNLNKLFQNLEEKFKDFFV